MEEKIKKSRQENKSKKLSFLPVLLFFIFILSGLLGVQPLLDSLSPAPVNETGTCSAAEFVVVTKVLDGDTILVEGGEHIRLIGIEADESAYPCYEQAKERLEDLILGKTVRLEQDVSDVDLYGRCLRYVFLDGGNINIQMVAEGVAVARFYEPDTAYKDEIIEAEQQAKENGLGCKWEQ